MEVAILDTETVLSENYKEKERFLTNKREILDADGLLTDNAKTEIGLKIDEFNSFLLENPTKKQIIIDYFTKCKDTPNYLYSIIDVASTIRNVNSSIKGDYIKILANIIVKKLSTKSFFYTYGPNQDCIHLALILLFYPLKVEYIPERHADAITTKLEFKRLREECEKIDKIQALSSERIDELSERYKKMEQQLKEYEEMMAKKYATASSESTETILTKVPVPADDTTLDVTDDKEWDTEFEPLNSSNVQDIVIKTPQETLASMLDALNKFKSKSENTPYENCSKITDREKKKICIANEAKINKFTSKIKDFCRSNRLQIPFQTTRKGGKRSNKRKTKKSKNTHKKSTRKNKNRK